MESIWCWNALMPELLEKIKTLTQTLEPTTASIVLINQWQQSVLNHVTFNYHPHIINILKFYHGNVISQLITSAQGHHSSYKRLSAFNL